MHFNLSHHMQWCDNFSMYIEWLQLISLTTWPKNWLLVRMQWLLRSSMIYAAIRDNKALWSMHLYKTIKHIKHNNA